MAWLFGNRILAFLGGGLILVLAAASILWVVHTRDAEIRTLRERVVAVETERRHLAAELERTRTELRSWKARASDLRRQIEEERRIAEQYAARLADIERRAARSEKKLRRIQRLRERGRIDLLLRLLNRDIECQLRTLTDPDRKCPGENRK